MSEPLWVPSADQIARARRLIDCGFACFESENSPKAEELRYAEYEFQLYTLHAKWLAIDVDGVVARAPSQQVNADLRALTAGLRLGEEWDVRWEACLDRWRKRATDDPEPPYVCPVVISRAKKGAVKNPDESTPPPEEFDRANVWTISGLDLQHYFFARDFSGMFSISSDDPAYRAAGDYMPPPGLFDETGSFQEAWLFQPRSFMQIIPYPLQNLIGVAVQPWRGCELLPALLGHDEPRIRADAKWRSLFRVIRSVSQIECDGFFDRLQGYDAVHMSLPLFHYTLNKLNPNKALDAELGGMLNWIERFEPSLARALAAAGLSAYKSDPAQASREHGYKETRWADDRGWGKAYDAASGAGCEDGARVVGCVSIGDGVIDSKADVLLLRRPHFHYRVTMLMRTLPRLRVAAWKLAIHRLRNLAWWRIEGLHEELKDRVVLGRVLTSELSMAIALRMNIFAPNGQRVLKTINEAWVKTREVRPNDAAEDLQEEFEFRFCQSFFNDPLDDETSAWEASEENASLFKLPSWPFKNRSVFGSRLRQTHLVDDGNAVPADPPPPRLSWAPATSPFWATPDEGPAAFADPVAALESTDDFEVDAHPTTPLRYPEVDATEDFGPLGTQVEAPASFTGTDVFPQRIREALGIRSAPYVLVNGTLKSNTALLRRRLHKDNKQFWARRQIRDMQDGKIASALRCGTASVAPAPIDALWALHRVAPGQTVRAFDWRNGMPAVGTDGEAFAKTGTGGKIASDGDRFAVTDSQNFGAFLSPLQLKTFNAFALALGKGAGVTHVDQFRVEPGPSDWRLTLAGMRQEFKREGSVPATSSEWGLLIELLAWRHAAVEADKDGWFGGPFNVMRNLGFDAWVPEPIGKNPAFLRQAWPAPAHAPVPRRIPEPNPAPIDGLALRSVPRLWNAPKPRTAASDGDLAAVMLSWPSLYRMRQLFQQSAQARRAVYDLWRMGMRAALSLPLAFLKPTFGKNLPFSYQLFQSSESIAALASWRYLDGAGLRRALQSEKGDLSVKANKWFSDLPARKNFQNWSSEDEYAFVWDVVLPNIPESAVREALLRIRPLLPVPPRDYAALLNAVMDLAELDSTLPPIPQIDYQAVLLRQPAANVGLGLLSSPASAEMQAAVAIEAAAHALAEPEPEPGSEFWVGGIAPMLKVGDGLKAVPLMLPQPVKVRLSQGVAETVQVGTYWARDGVEEVLGFSAFDISGPFTVEADVSSWLGELAQDLSVKLLASASASETGSFALNLGLRLTSSWLHKPLEWSRQVVEISGIEIADIAGGKELVWRFPLADVVDRSALPIGIDENAAVELGLGIKSGAVTARFSLRASALTIGLGSPVASLRLQAEAAPLAFDADLLSGSAVVGYPGAFAAYLALELAALPGSDGAARIVPTDDETEGARTPPFDILLARFGSPAIAELELASRAGIDVSNLSRPRIPAWLFENGAASHNKIPRFRLLDIAANWLEDAAESAGAFVSANKPPVIVRSGDNLELTLPVLVELAGMRAEASFETRCAVDAHGYLQLRGDSFACGLSGITLAMDVTGDVPSLGSIAKLRLPRKVEARLTLDGSDPGSCFRLLVREGDHPVLTVPSTGGINFDISEFALGSGGLTLASKVRKDVVALDLPVLDRDLVVQEPRDGIGEFRVVRGRLVSASLQAKARLKVFDDAEGVLTMRIVEDAGGLAIMAELDVGVGKTFHLRALYLQVMVASISLSLRYGSNGRWTAQGGMTGSMKFVPEGPMLGRLQEYQSLFDGTSVHFEKMDLARLGESPITVMVTPRTFDVGSMFSVTWRGFVLQRPGDLQAFMGLRLLGDVTFKYPLPSMRVALTLGDISIRQQLASSLIPKIAISSIGIEIGLSGGFSFKGRITEFDDAYEYGFGGEVELRSEAFPATQALIKLTRLREDPSKPSIAVYASTARNDSLGYGFFLRKVGIGAGVRQGLRGFSDEPGHPTGTSIATRVANALRDPRGLPYPAHLSSWQALKPGQRPEYVLVAYVLITFGLLKPDVDHPLAASAVVAIDDNLDIIVGLNGWFVTSPDNTGNDDYIARPAIKGALALSPREQVLYGRFMTLPGSKFGPTAEASQLMFMLKTALDAVRLSVATYADPRGALIEVGWPRNARFEASLGPAKGWAEAGFRFGFYRGTQVVGLNLAVHAEIGGGFSQDMGFANVSLSVIARFQLQATFAGAVTSSGQCYVLAEVMLSALLEVSAHVYKRIRISGWGFSYTHTLFDVSATIGISASAALQTAIVPSGLGFNGSVEVHIQVAGFGIGARVRISSSEGRVEEARRTIAALVPPIADLIQAGSRSTAAANVSPVLGNAQLVAEPLMINVASTTATVATPALAAPAPATLPTRWRCHVVRAGAELRVVLFPDATSDQQAVGYPPQAPLTDEATPFAPRTHKLCLNAAAADAFKGVVGQVANLQPRDPDGAQEVVLIEAADDVLLSHDWMSSQHPDAPRALYAGDLLSDLAIEASEGPGAVKEVVDPRTIHPVAGDFDDPAVLANPGRRSTRFRKRYGQDDVPTYDDHVRRAAETERNDAPAQAGGTRSGELLMQLLNMARDSAARPGEKIVGPLAGDPVYSPHLLASRLGLVLSFEWSKELEAQLSERGLAAIVDPAKPQPVMFGQLTTAADWTAEASHRARFQIVPGYTFEGKGEVGLTWSVLRTDASGKVTRDGPGNHAGIAAFRIQRMRDDSSQLPASATMKVIPSWLRYVRGGVTYYVRPQFQFLDSSLPMSGTSDLEYLVEALADDAANTILASQVIRVTYRAPSSPFSLVQAQAMLRLPPELPADAPKALAPYRLELLVQVDVDTRAMPERVWTASPANLAKIAGRIQVLRRRLDSGVLGRYGQGHDGQVSVSWSQKEEASEVSLPETDQARQLTVDDFDLDTDQLMALAWEPAIEAALPDARTTALSFRASVDIRVASEKGDWDRILGAGINAAELHVRLNSARGGPVVPPELATALLRCRIALTRDAIANPTAGKPTPSPAEGTEVAALERVPLAAAVERAPEWLPLGKSTSTFRAEVAPQRFVAGGRPEDIGLRLRGIVNHDRHKVGSYGAVVGYRVWALDRFDVDQSRRTVALADFLVEPEALYRATPIAVTVRQLAGGAPGQSNWRFESDMLRMAPIAAPEALMPDSFKVRRLHGGQEASLHASLIALSDDLESGRYQAHFHADEPMWPSLASGGDRLDELVKRRPAASDSFGWGLLEALGGSATLWIERDDDRLGIEAWMGTLGAHKANVAAVMFSRLQPGERPDMKPLTLFGVRVFSRAMLAELLAIKVSTQGVAQCLTAAGSQLALALRLLDPRAKPGKLEAKDIPDTWIAYVNALLGRMDGFVALPDPRRPDLTECVLAAMWELVKVPASREGTDAAPDADASQDVNGQVPATLPSLGGQVHVFHTMENGYAHELEVAVEVVRRYDIVAPRTARTMPVGSVHVVPVMRTQALEAERWAMAPDPDTGALTALVAVHSAQRLVLYRSDLQAQVQFIEQKVRLQRTVADAASRQWNDMFAALGSSIYLDAYRRSWVPGEQGSAPPLSDWTLANEVTDQTVQRAYDTYRYTDLPPFYEYGVSVRTQAGVRHSAEIGEEGAAPAMAEAMFTAGAGLAYRAPALSWELTDEGETLRFTFALVRGADALRPMVRAHWIARDQLWQMQDGDEETGLAVPVLQLPDLRARYSLIATGVSHDGPPLRVELLQLAHDGPALTARLLVGDPGVKPVEAAVVQLEEPDEQGPIGIACAISLAPAELGWLRVGLGREDGGWSLGIEVRRGGMHYDEQRNTP